MEFVIDFQAFKTIGNKFVVKELAVCALKSNVVTHFFIKPPTSGEYPLPKQQISNRYVLHHLHAIPWDMGIIEFEDAVHWMKDVLFNPTHDSVPNETNKILLYIKGSERCTFLRKLFESPSISIIDLDELGCPQAAKISCSYPEMLGPYHLECPFDKHRNWPQFRCALTNTQRYKDWLLSEKQHSVIGDL